MIRRFSLLAFCALLPLAGLAETPSAAPAPAPATPRRAPAAATTVSASTAGAREDHLHAVPRGWPVHRHDLR